MPIPDDVFFEAWEAELPGEERSVFCRDGVVDEAAWAAAPLRVLVVTAEANLNGWQDWPDAAARDLRALGREVGGTGPFGTTLARWAGLLLDGAAVGEVAALGRTARRRQARRVACINLKKTGGRETVPPPLVAAWASAHRVRILDQIRRIAPDVALVCGNAVHLAWPRVTLAGDRPLQRGDRSDFEGRPVLGSPTRPRGGRSEPTPTPPSPSSPPPPRSPPSGGNQLELSRVRPLPVDLRDRLLQRQEVAVRVGLRLRLVERPEVGQFLGGFGQPAVLLKVQHHGGAGAGGVGEKAGGGRRGGHGGRQG